jgi:Concanavalin A-like lectin/glucanases superfamily
MRTIIRGIAVLVLGLVAFEPSDGQTRDASRPKIWKFDRIDKIGGLPTTIVGHPRVIKTPIGKAIQFNGVDDAIYLPEHPLAGASAFTFEAIFRPESGGAVEQRWFHLAERDPKTGKDTDTRFLFEIRVINNQWCLDAFVHTPIADKALLFRDKLHPLDVWTPVAMVYDGQEFRSYVNGVLQGKAAIHFEPQGPGHSSVGVRINKVNYFKGSVKEARFTRRALDPSEFLKVPADKAAAR